MRKFFEDEKGAAALVTVIIISAASLVLVKTAAWQSLVELDTAYSYEKGRSVFSLAETCANEALRRIQIEPEYEEIGKILTIGENSCTYSISSSLGRQTIASRGIAGDYYYDLAVEARNDSGKIEIISWE